MSIPAAVIPPESLAPSLIDTCCAVLHGSKLRECDPSPSRQAVGVPAKGVTFCREGKLRDFMDIEFFGGLSAGLAEGYRLGGAGTLREKSHHPAANAGAPGADGKWLKPDRAGQMNAHPCCGASTPHPKRQEEKRRGRPGSGEEK